MSRDPDARLARRAARTGWNVPSDLRDEMRDVLASIARDPNASPRDRRGAASALMQAHRAEMDAVRLGMEVEEHTTLRAELEELRSLLDAERQPATGIGPTPPDDRGPEGPQAVA